MGTEPWWQADWPSSAGMPGARSALHMLTWMPGSLSLRVQVPEGVEWAARALCAVPLGGVHTNLGTHLVVSKCEGRGLSLQPGHTAQGDTANFASQPLRPGCGAGAGSTLACLFFRAHPLLYFED